jgi:hypothetical protein
MLLFHSLTLNEVLRLLLRAELLMEWPSSSLMFGVTIMHLPTPRTPRQPWPFREEGCGRVRCLYKFFVSLC